MNRHPFPARLPLLTATLAATLSLGACVVYPEPRPGVDQGVVAGGFGTPAPVYTPAPAYGPAPVYGAPPPVYYDDSYYGPYYGPSYSYGPGYYYGPSVGVSGTFIYSDRDHGYHGPSYRPPSGYYDHGNRPGPRPGGYDHGGNGNGGGHGGNHGGGRSGDSPLGPALRGVLGKHDHN